jgi:hypothetical protein
LSDNDKHDEKDVIVYYFNSLTGESAVSEDHEDDKLLQQHITDGSNRPCSINVTEDIIAVYGDRMDNANDGVTPPTSDLPRHWGQKR